MIFDFTLLLPQPKRRRVIYSLAKKPMVSKHYASTWYFCNRVMTIPKPRIPLLFMKKSFLIIATLAVISLSSQPLQAQARSKRQSNGSMDTMFGLKLMVGLGGEVEIDDVGIASIEDDLEPTFGGGFEVDFPLHRYFLLGGMVSFHSWIWDEASDADLDRSILLDFSVVPKLRYPFKKSVFAITLGVPVGLCVDLLDDDILPAAEVDTGIGFNLSVLIGLQAYLSSSFGLMAELGYTFHSFSHEVEFMAEQPVIEADAEMGQFALNIGFYFM